ncbi:MAG: response regulator transcription factor [Pseudomonadota bacterium]|jgi:two-component system, OmpR family, response regulator|uniref:response regulator transcription factor n=1 Tax=Limnobacter alexandrii TaxID=2570352 RepID=UPI001109657C|nr:response regulator transcription factor [Limnobacter alexandrii]
MRLLLVEDDPVLGAQLHKLLGKSGYAADWVQDGAEAEIQGRLEPYDLVVLDLGLPGKPGLDVLKSWRAQGLKLPVIVLTARGTWQEKVEGFNAGADDYVPKPFQPEELLARIGAVLKRAAGNAPDALNARGLVLDETLQTVQVNDESPQQLTATEFRLLRYFMLHPGQPLSKTRLTDHVYEYDADKDSNVMEVYVNRLRKKIGPQWIQTRKGQGYVFGEPTE